MFSTLDAAISKLYQLVSTTLAITQPDVQVLDGPDIVDVGQDVIAVGITADDSIVSADYPTAGLVVQAETYDLECLVRSWNGDPDLAARRARAVQLFEEVARLVKGNPTLDQTVARARIVRADYHPLRLPEGAVATLSFRVRIEAFTR